MVRSAFLLGSVAPDVPLILLSLGGLFYFRVLLGWDQARAFSHLYDHLFFNDPGWIAAHNLLHAPLSVIALLGLASFAARRGRGRVRRAAHWATWFLAACGLHSFVDVFTHHDDGPLLFFPFDWVTRFESPVSYWDSRHYGLQFTMFEAGLDLCLLAYLAAPRLRALLEARRTRAAEMSREDEPQALTRPQPER